MGGEKEHNTKKRLAEMLSANLTWLRVFITDLIKIIDISARVHVIQSAHWHISRFLRKMKALRNYGGYHYETNHI